MFAKKLFSLFLCLFIGVSSSLMIVNAEEENAVLMPKETQNEDEGELDVTGEPLYYIDVFSSEDDEWYSYVDKNELVGSVPGMSWDAENHVLSVTDQDRPKWQLCFSCEGYAGEPVKMNFEGDNVFCSVESDIPLEISGSGTLSTGFVIAPAFTMTGGTLNLKGELLKEYFIYYTEEEDMGAGAAIYAPTLDKIDFDTYLRFDNCTVNVSGVYQRGIEHLYGDIDVLNSTINIRIPKYGYVGLACNSDYNDPERGGKLTILDSSISVLLMQGDTFQVHCNEYVDVNGNLKYYAGVNTGQQGLSFNEAFRIDTYDRVNYTIYRYGMEQNYFMITDRFMFSDVSDPSRYYFEPVYWAFNHDPQITTGTSPTQFSPDKNVTRGQMVTFLYRLAGVPEEGSKTFDDVDPSRYYAKAISWAASEGITTGYAGTNNFGPDDNCTREQIVTFLWRYAGSPEPVNQASFTDAKAGAYYLDALSWAAENGITVGLNDGTGRFGVGHTCTRGMCVTFLYRYASLGQK